MPSLVKVFKSNGTLSEPFFADISNVDSAVRLGGLKVLAALLSTAVPMTVQPKVQSTLLITKPGFTPTSSEKGNIFVRAWL
jgi:hypothetical protein